MPRLSTALLTSLILAVAPTTFVACSTPGYKKADSAADNMRSAEGAADALLMSAQNAQTFANSLQAGELKAMFPKFEKEVDTFESNLKRLRGSISGVRSSTNQYVASLQKTQESISSSDLKAKTESRISNISVQLADIDGIAGNADSIATEVLSGLSDLRTFLRADLSARAVTDSAPTRKAIDSSIARLGTALNALKKELADVETAIGSDA
jgi:hypothetical protein